jgi:hypothetical protein
MIHLNPFIGILARIFMSEYSQYTPSQRSQALTTVLRLLPEDQRTQARSEIESLVECFDGQEVNTLGVLYRATEKGKFHEFAGKLRDYYLREGKKVPLETRGLPIGQDVQILRHLISRAGQTNPNFPPQLEALQRSPAAIKMELFFFDCYEEIKRVA